MKKKTKIILSLLLCLILITSVGCVSAFADGTSGASESAGTALQAVKSSSLEIALIISSFMLLALGVMSGSELMPFFKKCFACLVSVLSKRKEEAKEDEEKDELSEQIGSRLKKAENALSEIEGLLKRAASEFQKLDAEAKELEKMGISISDYLSAIYDAIADTKEISETLEGINTKKSDSL